jgi:pimeloyl-ACP methyl ester carboxylesterase
MTFSDYPRAYADLKDVRIHYRVAGEGMPVLLIHGIPETSYAWRHVAPQLADKYHLVMPDLRGLGDSSKPYHGYDKKTLANDLWLLMSEHLGIKRFAVVGHDFGSPVASRLAIDHPDAVTHLALLDVGVPGAPGAAGGVSVKWWHLFHQVPNLPEALVAGRERIYLETTMNAIADNPVFTDADFDEYTRALSQPGAFRATCDFYRAMAQDVADNSAVFQTGFKLPMPTLGIGGGGPNGRGGDVVESLQHVALHAEGGAIPDCGHWIAEEKPRELAERLDAFFSSSLSDLSHKVSQHADIKR